VGGVKSIRLHFLLFPPATEKMASRGSRGTAMSPPGRRRDAANCLPQGCTSPRLPMPTPSGCTRLFGFRPSAASRPSHPDTPRRPFGYSILRRSCPRQG
jgi:hypothetical protein